MDEAVSALCQYLPFFRTIELPGDDGLHFYQTQVRALPCLVNASVVCEDADFTQPLLANVESNCWRMCQAHALSVRQGRDILRRGQFYSS